MRDSGKNSGQSNAAQNLRVTTDEIGTRRFVRRAQKIMPPREPTTRRHLETNSWFSS